MNLPGAGAGEKGYTAGSGPEREVHGQTVAANQATVIPYVAQMLA